eukprot:m.477233 g.477233  ORF g.477233 m.477233 type:complete len:292 (-) comp20783_c0_seq1:691-1566(-)
MGCDGGTIPTRDELVKVKKKPVKLDPLFDLAAKFKHCAFSGQPLREPMVGCELGRLYNKEAILSLLLNRDSVSKEQATIVSHIKSLKDVKELNLTKSRDQADDDHLKPTFVCPVTGLELNGLHRFYIFWTCGCVVSERAVREAPSDTCHKCGSLIKKEDMITIHSQPAEVELLRERMKARRQAAKAAKKAAKAAAKAAAGGDDAGDAAEKEEKKKKKKKRKAGEEQKTAQQPKTMKINAAFVTPELSQKIAAATERPKGTKAFESIFTSSTKPDEQDQASWTSRTTLSTYF